MAKRDSKTNEANDYYSQISLNIKEKDLKNNSALVKKFLAELKDAKADNLGLRDSLESTQNTLEALRTSFHEIDKENAVLKAASDKRLGISIIQDLSAVGFGGGFGALITGQWVIGLSITIPTLILYLICRVINSKK